MKVLILDNYDSFVYNIAQHVGSLGADPIVRRNDEITVEEIRQLAPDRIIISPGPGNPEEVRSFGICGTVISEFGPTIPTLGICLGNQGIGCTFGARIVRAGVLMHGKTSRIIHDGKGVLSGVENPLVATRYHSLVIDRNSLPSYLKVTALSLDDGEIMGIRHASYPIEGIQFHPESIMTKEGIKILHNFLRQVGG